MDFCPTDDDANSGPDFKARLYLLLALLQSARATSTTESINTTSSTTTVPEFSYYVGDWSDCSATCEIGSRQREEWDPLAKKHLEGRQITLHTDAAKSYKAKIKGVLHDNVRRCKKRIKVKGKWKWQAPVYVRIAVHKCPKTGKKIRVKAGARIIDRAWRFLKDRVHVQSNSKVGSATLKAQIRSAQYEYWHMGQDLWKLTGSLCQWDLEKFASAA
eukprot:Skav227691  [mRNA]  locus=scaffold2761:67974:77290:- [translate_table: standard]